MIAETSAANACDFRLRCGPRTPLCVLVCAQPRQCIARKLRVVLRYAPYQIEKERKRAWRFAVRPFMLQRTTLR